MPGNVLLPAAICGLPRDSVVNVSRLLTLNRYDLRTERAGCVPADLLSRVDGGLAQVLGLRLAG